MQEREELIDEVEAILGLIPSNTRLILNTITHPDVIDYTKRYIHARDTASLCQKFQAPWDCAKEAEARFENVQHGWLGAVSEVMGTDEDWWCEPCRKRVIE